MSAQDKAQAMVDRITPSFLRSIWAECMGSPCAIDEQDLSVTVKAVRCAALPILKGETAPPYYTKAEAVAGLEKYIAALDAAHLALCPDIHGREFRDVSQWIDELDPESWPATYAALELIEIKIAGARQLLAQVKEQRTKRGQPVGRNTYRDELIFLLVSCFREWGANAENARVMCAEVMNVCGLQAPQDPRDVRRIESAYRAAVETGSAFLNGYCVMNQAAGALMPEAHRKRQRRAWLDRVTQQQRELNRALTENGTGQQRTD